MTSTRVGESSLARWQIRLLVTLGAALAAIIVFVIAQALGADAHVPEQFGSSTRIPLELGAVVPAALVASFAGWALLEILERLTDKALMIWTVIALFVFLVSLPFMPAFSVSDRIVIALMHLALAVVLIVGLRSTATPTS
jgi:hypothetical protein